MINEKYYWQDAKGDLIPKHELSNLYICNIVMRFGKEWLNSNGHKVIVNRFEEMNKEYDFFKTVK